MNSAFMDSPNLSQRQTGVLTRAQIAEWLRTHQRRLRAGDDLPSIVQLADRAGVHRDTVYALLSGDRINVRSQYALSHAIKQIEEETSGVSRTRLMSISLGSNGPRLSVGLAAVPMLRRR